MISLNALQTLDEAKTALERSQSHPLFVFKHSDNCGISARALRETETFLETCELPIEARLVVVQEAREASNFFAERLGVEHETPQAMLVINGVVRWEDSHSRLKAERIKTALEDVFGTLEQNA